LIPDEERFFTRYNSAFGGKNLSKEVVLGAVESALVSAYRKIILPRVRDITVKIDPNNAGLQFGEKTVMEKVSDTRSEISLDEPEELRGDRGWEELVVEATPSNAGVLQRRQQTGDTASACMKRNTALFMRNTPISRRSNNRVVRRIEPKQCLSTSAGGGGDGGSRAGG
jgi:N utilization substance protein A